MSPLPERIDPSRLARQDVELFGHIPVSSLPRLSSALFKNTGEVEVHWFFEFNYAGRPCIRGNLKTRLEFKCLRCMGSVDYSFDLNQRLELFYPGQSIEKASTDYETVELEETPVLFKSLVENELILALPLVARHDICPNNTHRPVKDEQTLPESGETIKPNPFSVLSTLKNNK